MDENRAYLIVAGGTGGHISPGTAIAARFVAKNIPVRMLSLKKNRNTPDFSGGGFAVDFYSAPPLPTGPSDALLFPFRFASAFLNALNLIRRGGIRAVIGMGGYSILPAMMAAIVLGRELYLCEQNAVPGKATILYARFAKRIFLTFPDVQWRLSRYSDRTVMTGNPVRARIVTEALRHRKKSQDGNAAQSRGEQKRVTVLLLGGSQGSVQLNEMVRGCVGSLPGVRWLIQCGERNINTMKRELSEIAGVDIELFGYHSSIHELYARADLLIGRSGAGILTEAAAFSLPMILVPYPYAADNHQLENALVYAKAGAARVIDTKARDPLPLKNEIMALIGDEDLLRKMGLASSGLARLDAAERIVEEIVGMDR